MKNTKIEDAATESREEKRKRLRKEFENEMFKKNNQTHLDFPPAKANGLFVMKNHISPYVRNYITDRKLKPQIIFYGTSAKIKYGLVIDGEQLNFSFHRLIALLFVPMPRRYINFELSELQVHHIDKNTMNNYDFNLMWVSKSDHYKIHSLIKRFPEVTRMSRKEIYDLLDELETEPERKEVQNNERTHD